MNQPKQKKRPKLNMPVTFMHKCNTKNIDEYMPIANVTEISKENALRREAKNADRSE